MIEHFALLRMSENTQSSRCAHPLTDRMLVFLLVRLIQRRTIVEGRGAHATGLRVVYVALQSA